MYPLKMGFPSFSVVNYLSAMKETQKTQARSLGQEDYWKWERIPTPVFLPGEFHGPRNLVDYSPQGHTELDTTEAT